ncbi:MAG: hypothetical protein IJ662_06070 [Clostridia bacterium]|nr:hypothetical protein [Clostridia bacterium]
MKPCNPCGDAALSFPCPPSSGGCLAMRILACGQLHRRPECVFLCPDSLPCGARPPFTVLSAVTCGADQWEALPACRGGVRLLLKTPVSLRVRDGCGTVIPMDLTLQAELTLRCRCPENELWRGQYFVQSAVRPWRGRLPRQNNGWEIPLEWLAQGFVLSPGVQPFPDPCRCADPRPLYPPAPCDQRFDESPFYD